MRGKIELTRCSPPDLVPIAVKVFIFFTFYGDVKSFIYIGRLCYLFQDRARTTLGTLR